MRNALITRTMAILGLTTLLAGAGCENIALVHRPAPEIDGDEIVGELTGIDMRLKEIYLRPTQDNSSRSLVRTIRFDDGTQVIYRGKEYPVSSLEEGDVVALQVWNRDRGGWTNLIRVQQNSRDRDLSSSETQRIEGTVERVDASAAMFELRATSGANVRVSLPPNAQRSMADQVERLHRGNRVLAEGRYLSRDRFELDRLL
jgi:hypothetical protein